MAKEESSKKGFFGFFYGLIGYVADPIVNRYYRKQESLGWLIKAMEGSRDIPIDIKERYLTELRNEKRIIEDFPNTLVTFRLWLSWLPALFAYLIFRFHSLSFLIAALVSMIALASTDALDGRIARKLGVHNRPWGKKWDPIADKALTVITIFALAVLVWVTSRIQFQWKIPFIVVALFYVAVEIRLYYLANYYLPKENGKAKVLGEKKVAGANNIGKIKFTVVFLSILTLLVGFFLVETGRMASSVFAAIALVLLMVSALLGLFSAYKRRKEAEKKNSAAA